MPLTNDDQGAKYKSGVDMVVKSILKAVQRAKWAIIRDVTMVARLIVSPGMVGAA